MHCSIAEGSNYWPPSSKENNFGEGESTKAGLRNVQHIIEIWKDSGQKKKLDWSWSQSLKNLVKSDSTTVIIDMKLRELHSCVVLRKPLICVANHLSCLVPAGQALGSANCTFKKNEVSWLPEYTDTNICWYTDSFNIVNDQVFPSMDVFLPWCQEHIQRRPRQASLGSDCERWAQGENLWLGFHIHIDHNRVQILRPLRIFGISASPIVKQDNSEKLMQF